MPTNRLKKLTNNIDDGTYKYYYDCENRLTDVNNDGDDGEPDDPTPDDDDDDNDDDDDGDGKKGSET